MHAERVGLSRCWPRGASTTDGKPVFVGLEAASSESGDAWEGFLAGLGERGLACPLLVISDGAAGLIGAVEAHHGRRAATAVSGASREN